jgi:hypothetical protein
LGIGTTSPSNKLDVLGTAASPNLTGTNAYARFYQSGGYANITIGGLASGSFAGWLQSSDGVGTALPLALNPNGGNVGIGTTSPVSKLTIGSYSGARLPYINGTGTTFGAEGITVTSSNTSNTSVGGGIDLTNNVRSVGAYSPVISFSSMTSGGTYNNSYAGIWGIYQEDDGNWAAGHIAFGTSNPYGIQEKMRLTKDGNLGIGTTSPGSKLSIVGLPTSSSGLSSGDIWNDSGTLKIV